MLYCDTVLLCYTVTLYCNGSDVFHQMIQDELDENAHRLQYIDKAAQYLMAKCDAVDAVHIQNSLDEFHYIRDQIRGKLIKCSEKLRRITLGEV